MLLAAVVLPLEGEGVPEARHVQGWFYRLVREADPQLHDRKGPRPFTLGVLPGPPPALRITFLDGGLHARLSPRLWSLVGEEVALGERVFRIRSLLESGHPWSGLTTYPRLFQGAVATDYPLRFASPTFFKRKGVHYPLPEPALVFHSLLGKFVHFARVPVPDGLEEALARVTFRSYRLRTVSIVHEVRAVGFAGSAVFHLPRASEWEARWLTALWRFSFFAGVGAKTSLGFGRVRPLKVRVVGGERDGRGEEEAQTGADRDRGEDQEPR